MRLEKMFIIIGLFLVFITSSFAKPYELLPNGDLEKIKDGKPLNWFNMTRKGSAKITTNAQKGKFAIHLKSATDKDGDNDNLIFYTGISHGGVGGYPAIPGGKYKATVMARGKGRIIFYLNFSRASGGHIRSCFLRESKHNLIHEWKQYSEDIVLPNNPELSKVSFGIALTKNTDVILDNISFTFDPDDNPKVKNIYDIKVYTRDVPFKIETQNSIAEVFLNGKKILNSNNQYNLKLNEGINVLGMQLKRTGTPASLLINAQGCPEINDRWKSSNKKFPNWLSADFDDSKLKVPESKKTDGAEHIDLKYDTTYFRQIIIWNKTHYGPNRLIVPPVKVYGIPEEGTEFFKLALYSPLHQNLKNFEIQIELPLGFKILDFGGLDSKEKGNVKPSKVTYKPSDDKTHTIYTLAYDDVFLSSNKTCYTFVPVKMKTVPKEKNISFFYRRKANGNLTELKQVIPIKILPPINGKTLKKIKIQQYHFIPTGKMATEHIKEYTRQCVKAGCNSIIINPGKEDVLTPVLYKEYLRNNSDIETFIWFEGSFPLRLKLWGNVPDYVKEMINWAEKNPEAKPRYFNNKPEQLWINGNEGIYYGVLCPSYITGPGKEAFKKIIKKLWEVEFRKYPKSKGIFIDWEESPWNSKSQMGLWCFCDRCKDKFRKSLNISSEEPLTDDIIRKKYHKEWELFRVGLEGEVIGTLKEICAEMDKEIQVYQWEGDFKFWKACRDKVDIVFSTVPGNSPAKGNRQEYIDKCMADLNRVMGIKKIVGQRFPYLNLSNKKDSWKNILVCSNNGFFMEQKIWKSEVLRIIAGVHGGIDIQCAMQLPAGALFYIGEATKIINEYEDLFLNGQRVDHLASSSQLAYPNLLVLQNGDKRLILAFNESDKPLEVDIINKDLKKSQRAEIFEKQKNLNPEKITLTIAPNDVGVIHIKNQK